MTAADLPPINAALNAASATLLAIGYASIRAGKWKLHAYLMVAALISSGAFLTCYLFYHYHVGHRSSGIPSGLFKTTYLLMLLTHVVLAVAMLPMIFMTILRAYRREWERHKKIARPTFWIWMYVSITGVVIYFVLYHLVPAMYASSAT